MSTSSKIRVLVVDDEPLARTLICRLVEKDADMLIIGTCSNGAEAMHKIDTLHPDLVFIDVQMPEKSGVEVVEKTTGAEGAPCFVFVTAFDQYAVRAFEVDALDYLLKPIQSDRFLAAILRAKKAIQQRRIRSLSRQIAKVESSYEGASDRAEDPHFTVRRGDELVSLAVSDIVWIEAAGQYVNVHTDRESYIVAESLKSYHKRLPDSMFIRVHRSAVVNRQKLARIFRRRNGVHSLELRDGSVVPLARSRKKMLNDLLKDCIDRFPKSRNQ